MRVYVCVCLCMRACVCVCMRVYVCVCMCGVFACHVDIKYCEMNWSIWGLCEWIQRVYSLHMWAIVYHIQIYIDLSNTSVHFLTTNFPFLLLLHSPLLRTDTYSNLNIDFSRVFKACTSRRWMFDPSLLLEALWFESIAVPGYNVMLAGVHYVVVITVSVSPVAVYCGAGPSRRAWSGPGEAGPGRRAWSGPGGAGPRTTCMI